MDIQNIEEYYAPKSVDDIVFASDADKELVTDIVSNARPFPAFGKNGILLYGINGTGKSALAKLLPDAIEAVKTGGAAFERFLRIQNGNNGGAVIKQLQQQAELMPFASHHYFVLDEVDNLTDYSMPSLKSLMNMPKTIFVMTTNNFSQIDVGVRSRCHCIPFNAAAPANWLPLARRMLTDAGIVTITDATLLGVIATGNGSAREILSAIVQLIVAARRKRASVAIAPPAQCVV
jgi:replication-associated recombination protein RarA